MIFSEVLKSHAEPLVKEIIQHRFLTDITTNTLAPVAIIAYVQQDEFYLSQYALALKAAADLAPSPTIAHVLMPLLFEPNSESIAHTWLLKSIDISQVEQLPTTVPNPTTQAYIDFLFANKSKDFFSLITALLPCAWVYPEFAKQLAPQEVTDNPLINWLQLYDNQFPDLLKMDLATVLFAILDQQTFTQSKQQQLLAIFLQGCSYEWHFFDATYFQKTRLLANTSTITMEELMNA
ncbi:hypothetical protein [Periweissella beninensis]|uniref:hypothetical protein n=1 Tax=Periweissella beninensis TaxID=504936 RepID=UPI0021A3FE2F|nr:hypothetical protein [Periweissella beninensis]MCT4395505.1 hypothetical protein [Periweissella beninensis]